MLSNRLISSIFNSGSGAAETFWEKSFTSGNSKISKLIGSKSKLIGSIFIVWLSLTTDSGIFSSGSGLFSVLTTFISGSIPNFVTSTLLSSSETGSNLGLGSNLTGSLVSFISKVKDSSSDLGGA